MRNLLVMIKLISIFLSLHTVLIFVLKPQSLKAAELETECNQAFVKTPPVFVVPTGYDAKSDQDAVERGRENKYANYYQGQTTLDEKNKPDGKPFIVPKRSLVLVSDQYRDLIEKTGTFSKSQGQEWVPIKVISLPPENKKLQEAHLKKTKEVAKAVGSSNIQQAEVGSTGFLKIADLEKVDKQKDFIFVVKQDSELFTKLNHYLKNNNYKSLLPLALKLNQGPDGYEVNQCCLKGTDRCTNYPIFQLMNVADKKGEQIDLPVDANCFVCQNNVFKSLVPLEESILNPIRHILSFPALGLPAEASDLKKTSSLSQINFVDSRGFVQIPLTGEGQKRIGPFNSLHYGAEPGNADAYLKPDVACGFMQFLKSWNQACQGQDDCLIEFGDASHAYHKNKVRTGKKNSPWPHVSHTNGECLDINTSRMADSKLGPMMRMLKKLGQSNCLTMESQITGQGGCSYDKTGVHDTHLHICFPSNTGSKENSVINPKLKESCENGVSL